MATRLIRKSANRFWTWQVFYLFGLFGGAVLHRVSGALVTTIIAEPP